MALPAQLEAPEPLHEAADGLVPFIRDGLLVAFAFFNFLPEHLHDRDHALSVLTETLFDFGDYLSDTLESAYTAVMEAAVATSPARGIRVFAEASLVPSLAAPVPARWINANVGALVTDITEEQRRTLTAELTAAFDRGDAPKAIAKRLTRVVGLTERGLEALNAYERSQAAAALPPGELDRRVVKYEQKLRRDRAELIASTETIRAANAALVYRWRQEQANGLLGMQAKKRWRATKDDRVDSLCRGLDGKSIYVGQAFKVGGWSGIGPPVHPNCRCVLDLTDVGRRQRAEAQVEDPTLALPEPETVDLTSLKPVDRNLPGWNQKQVYRGPDGRQWMFKPGNINGIAEVTGYAIMRELGFVTPRAELVRLDNRTGSLQEMHKGVIGALDTVDLRRLTRGQREQLQNYQVVNWLLGNRDAHPQNFLVREDGFILDIDKGSAFQDLKLPLDWRVHLGAAWRKEAYSRIAELSIRGEVPPLDPAAIEPTLRRVERMDENLFRIILRPYARSVAGRMMENKTGRRWGWATEEAFIDAMVERKRNIRNEFTAYYERLQDGDEDDAEGD